jgi:hypothetical protein
MAVETLPPDSENKTKEGYMSLWLVGVLGGVSGLTIGTIVGFILDAHYANFKEVECGMSGHENGGWHGDEDYSWYHDGPTYETYASVADQMWLLGGMGGGLAIGIIIAFSIAFYQRNKAEQPAAATSSASSGNWWSAIFSPAPKDGATHNAPSKLVNQ